MDTAEISLLAPVTLPENEVEEQEESNDLNELKISAQIMGYHAAKTILPALAIILTLACGITLSGWALMQLNKLPIQAFPNLGTQEVKKTEPAESAKSSLAAPNAVHSSNYKKTVTKAKPQTKTYKKRQATRNSTYQDPWADYYYYAPSHPRGGEITHTDGTITEYSWAKKK